MRTASKVFGAIGIFALFAALLLVAVGHNRDTIQGALVLVLFAVANGYLWRVLRHSSRGDLDGLVVPGGPPADQVQDNDPESLHLPGPSIFPAVFAVAGGLILIGLLSNFAVSYAGLALFVVASVGWARQAVAEHRFALQHDGHGGHGDHAANFDPKAIDLAHHITGFRALHGGTQASVQHLGRGSARIVLVGANGEWGDLVTDDYAAAEQACRLGGVESSAIGPTGIGAQMRNVELWQRMGGTSAPTEHGPRDGYLQVGARVFLAIGVFAVFAAVLFAISGLTGAGDDASTWQGALVLGMFGMANFYLYVFMKNARGGPDDAQYAGGSGIAAEPLDPAPAMDPDDIHLPGPSIWPAVFALAGGAILIGLITNLVLTWIGLGLFLAATVGWIAQAVGEYRLAQSGHGGHDSGSDHGSTPGDGSGSGDAVPVDHITAGQTH